MSTNVDLKIGLNLEIGSVPVSLDAELATNDGTTTYTFDGCVQDAVIDLGSFISYVGQQFGLGVLLPPELNLEADIDYVAGQVIYTKPATGNTSTELAVAAKFELKYTNGDVKEVVTLTFYADTILQAGSSNYVVGAAIDLDLDFSKLPLVGNIPVFNEYTLKHVGFSYTNAAQTVTFHIPKVDQSDNPLYTRTVGDGKDKLNYSISTKGNDTAFSLGQQGFSLTAALKRKGSDNTESNFALPMALPAGNNGNTPATYYNNGKPGSVQSSPPASPAHWIDINKTFGPVNLQKIGLNYQSGEATFGISAGLSLGGFSLDVQGLCITFPLPLPGMPAGSAVSFDIKGLAMDFKEAGLEIGGAFMKAESNGITNYFGEVIIQVAAFGFTAIGGYAPAQPDPNEPGKDLPAAFFIYASLEAPLGGPPFLYITGLAFGFGVNYALILPTMDTLPTYLLIPGSAPAQGNAQNALTQVIQQLEGGQVIQYQAGQYWVGFGIQFTSFEMITAFAMLTVSFGVETQVALLGSCSIALPQGVPDPLARIQVNLMAAITPSTGLFNVAGVITPASYIFGPFIKLTGGFAFYLWFGDAKHGVSHKGDFVVSLGGYHPAYKKPDWYPDVPRIRITFNLGPFQASGSSYLALTPSMFMTGMAVAATFEASIVKVWFNLGADFLIGWAPFQYQADAYVNVGCNLNVGLFTIKLHVGAALQLWGPPFGGRADVDLDIVTITIHFGSDVAAPLPVSWQDLEANFLPPPTKASNAMARRLAAVADPPEATANVTASVSVGLLGKDAASQDGEVWDWIIDPDHFSIVTATTIPANKAHWATGTGPTDFEKIPNKVKDFNSQSHDTSKHPFLLLPKGTRTYSKDEVWNPTIDVKPMDISGVKSVHTIALLKRTSAGSGQPFNSYLNTVSISPVLSNTNAALWGNPDVPSKDVNIETLLPCTLLGFNITPVPRTPEVVNNMPLIELLFTAGEQTNFSYTAASPDNSYTLTVTQNAQQETLDITVGGAASQQLGNSGYVLSSLTNSWVAGQRNTILADLVTNGWGTYAPAEVTLTLMSAEQLTEWPGIAVLGGLQVA